MEGALALIYYFLLLCCLTGFICLIVSIIKDNRNYARLLKTEAERMNGLEHLDEIRFEGTLVFSKEPGESKQSAQNRLLRILRDLGIDWLPYTEEPTGSDNLCSL